MRAAWRMRSRYSRTPAMTIARRIGPGEPAITSQDLEACGKSLYVPLDAV